METKNAIIESATLSSDDHGLLTAWLSLDYGGSGQGFGGYALYLPESYTHHPGQANFAGLFIWRVLEIAGVGEWSKLKGRTIRVRAEHSGVRAIGHIVKDDWFEPGTDFEKLTATIAHKGAANQLEPLRDVDDDDLQRASIDWAIAEVDMGLSDDPAAMMRHVLSKFVQHRRHPVSPERRSEQ